MLLFIALIPGALFTLQFHHRVSAPHSCLWVGLISVGIPREHISIMLPWCCHINCLHAKSCWLAVSSARYGWLPGNLVADDKRVQNHNLSLLHTDQISKILYATICYWMSFRATEKKRRPKKKYWVTLKIATFFYFYFSLINSFKPSICFLWSGVKWASWGR